ncbi:cellulose synthase subunit [Rhizobium sp. RU35A]|uniref:cellulose biosynthesis cyclic di-GMP-binding regulatory protein BcsB n=1 Tax=Rhizobium sp. RU35A TaxID=1907414 RepID=UPI0009557135|nr:cellulose biosynthesis cyclic di-GMP-binding regulatory protein BcsB [Rhizobium sp. RU35A]SIQ90277.1 cellulose synthase subunit [Rhizobium sp. RU35A]
MTRSSCTALPLLMSMAALITPAIGQEIAPFDMSPERSTLTAPAPSVTVPQIPARKVPVQQQPAATPAAPPQAPASATPARTATPPTAQAATPATPSPAQAPQQPVQRIPAPSGPARPETPRTTPVAEQKAEQKPAAAAEVSEKGRRRYLVPMHRLVLDGEYAERNWSIYLEDDEASGQTELQLTFQNAVVVAPEASMLKVFINGNLLVDEAIGAADAPRTVRVHIPPGLLQAGTNRVRLLATQRHRTDCDLRSTYDLWTEIDPSETFLVLNGERQTPDSLQETVRAIGVDGEGRSEFQVLMPALGQTSAATTVIQLSEGLSLMAAMPNLSFRFSPTNVPTPGRGQLGLIIGTWNELQPLYPQIPESARQAAIATILPGHGEAGETLLVTGPTWDSIRGAVDTIIGTVERRDGTGQESMTTQRWIAPDPLMMLGGENIPLSQFGVQTVEFSGRRLRTAFSIAIPSDFYANAYGEATLLLDAAYTDEVLPGSHIDVYVNDNIASTLPIKATDGGIFNQLPIKVPLRHIQPGHNRIRVEVMLDTATDAVCLPGTPAANKPRFAIFDSSRWVMPHFARLGQIPNLSALRGTVPFGETTTPLILSVDRLEPDTLSAATTLLGKRAMADGRTSRIEIGTTSQPTAERETLFVGTVSQIPPKLLTQFGIDPVAITTWHPQVGGISTPKEDTPASMSKWRSQVSGSLFGDRLAALERWLRRSFDLSLESFDILHRRVGLMEPSVHDTVLISQTLSPGGGARWTAAIASTSTDLRDGVVGLTEQEKWRYLAGRQTVYRAKTDEVIVRPATDVKFTQTLPFSLANMRLIATNWLSSNILIYAIVVVVLCAILGVATTLMLSKMGRRT